MLILRNVFMLNIILKAKVPTAFSPVVLEIYRGHLHALVTHQSDDGEGGA
jgi:hypothetical protein